MCSTANNSPCRSNLRMFEAYHRLILNPHARLLHIDWQYSVSEIVRCTPPRHLRHFIGQAIKIPGGMGWNVILIIKSVRSAVFYTKLTTAIQTGSANTSWVPKENIFELHFMDPNRAVGNLVVVVLV